mmetsp:Transcript_21604/g.32701  ORF Transcript_21604/g.32701 Transcript_21604/m.32701 type:complete len:209 (-) Transcript_21604:318-944(-)
MISQSVRSVVALPSIRVPSPAAVISCLSTKLKSSTTILTSSESAIGCLKSAKNANVANTTYIKAICKKFPAYNAPGIIDLVTADSKGPSNADKTPPSSTNAVALGKNSGVENCDTEKRRLFVDAYMNACGRAPITTNTTWGVTSFAAAKPIVVVSGPIICMIAPTIPKNEPAIKVFFSPNFDIIFGITTAHGALPSMMMPNGAVDIDA